MWGRESAYWPYLVTNLCSTPVLGLHLVELLAIGSQGVSKKSQTVGKATGGSAQTEGKALLLKTKPAQLNEHGELKSLPRLSLPQYVLASLVQKDTAHASKRQMKTPAQPQAL